MITDAQKDLVISQYYDRGILKKEIRSYEVSLWTLQDDFITVLKWSDVEQKGRIENPKLTLNIDGTENFTFTIPMYYRVNGVLMENPNWHNTQNGNLIRGLRKVKVIFNKALDEEEVFELVIVDIKEGHEGDISTCEITAEGLAFQELGKIGYKLHLSQDNFELIYKEWQEEGYWTNRYGEQISSEPLQTLDYWCQEACGLDKCPDELSEVNPRRWYYTVQMNHKSFESKAPYLRVSSKVYEESYPTAWNENLVPTATISYREKARPMSIDNSNLYNITQDLAKTFGIFCRYKYLYDENYHIIGHIIIFYNNFMQEDLGNLSFTYPYSAASTERQIESSDVTTKLYVLDVDNDTTLEGYNSIMNAQANMSGEDYILNFDYMLETKAITQEQYDEINPYIKSVRTFNQQLSRMQQQLSTYQIQLPELEAKKAVYDKSVDLDDEQILQNSQLRNALDSKDGDADGYIELTGANCDYCIIITDDSGRKYVNLKTTNKGIVESSVKVYKTWTSRNVLSDEMTNFTFDHDEYNNPTAIYFTGSIGTGADGNPLSRVYLTYKYDPHLYYDNIVKIWQVKKSQDKANANEVAKQIGPENANNNNGWDLSIYDSGTTMEQAYNMGLKRKIKDAEDTIQSLTIQKQEAIHAFERLMGPALREGYWQPESYKDYGDMHQYHSAITTSNITVDSGESAIIAWDTKLFDEEDTLFYYIGVEERQEFYPCIDLNAVFPSGIPADFSSYTLIWKATNNSGYTYDWNSVKDLQMFAVGSKALIKVLKYDGSYRPVLMITGAKTMTGPQLERMILTGEARLEKYSTTVGTDGSITVSHSNIVNLSASNWLCFRRISSRPSGWSSDLWSKYSYISNLNNTTLAYPRVKFSSLSLKTDSTNLVLKYGNTVLAFAEDYYVNTRDTDRSGTYYTEYYITLKPESLVKYGYSASKEVTVYYTLSNANTSIYLDALKVSKENAFPKVSYTVSTNVWDTNLAYTLYNKLAHVVMINDTELKFENVFGYISQLDLNLDAPWEDTIEVKNYTTKFEDLFSSIVAQTEAMRRNENAMGAMIAGDLPMSGEGLGATLDNQSTVIQAYLDSHFDTSEVVKERLASLFTEAGQILEDSNKAMSKMRALSTEGARILAGFAESVAKELTTKVYRGANPPDDFKTGDVWIQTQIINGQVTEIGRYVATSSSDMIDGTNNTSGFVRTYDGTLASITGAGMDINADDGIIDIYAQNELKLRSGKELYIAADGTVSIIGNEKVNIGGTEINLCSLAEKQLNPITGEFEYVLDGSGNRIVHTTTGINLIAGEYISGPDANYGTSAGSTSRVLIKPTHIEIGGATMDFKAASKINLLASTGATEGTSAIQISADDGIWLCAGAGLRIFGGATGDDYIGTLHTVYAGPTHPTTFKKGDYWIRTTQYETYSTYHSFYLNALALDGDYSNQFEVVSKWRATRDSRSTDTNSTSTDGWETLNVDARTAARSSVSTTSRGAAAEFNKDHLLLGYFNSTTGSGSTIEMTDEYVIIATGGVYKARALSSHTNAMNIKVTGTSSGLTGVKITREMIGMAIVNNSVTTALLMDKNGFTAGSGGIDVTTDDLRDIANGSYVRISGTKGIEMGSLADLYINTSNFKLQTHSRASADYPNGEYIDGNTILALGAGFNSASMTGRESIADLRAMAERTTNPVDIRLVCNQNGLYIKGNVYALAFVANSTNGLFKADASALGFYDSNGNAILTIDANAKIQATKELVISSTGGITINSGAGINITSTNFQVYSSPASGGNYFFVGNSSGNYMQYTSGGALEVVGSGTFTGTIYASAGTFSGELSAATGTFSGTVSASAISASDITGGTITGTAISGGTITGGAISGGTITGGTITGGTISGTDISGVTLTLGSTSDNSYLTYDGTNGLVVKGAIHATSLTIGGTNADDWLAATITDNRIWLGVTGSTNHSHFTITDTSIAMDSTGAFTLTGGSFWVSTNNFYINSAATGTGYVIYSNDNFMVDANGWVYAKKFVVDGQAIDFTQAFTNAVAISGSCSGSSLSVQAKFYNNNALVKTQGFTASANATTVTTGAFDPYYVKANISITFSTGISGTLTFENEAISAQYNINWMETNMAAKAIELSEYTSGSATFHTIRTLGYNGSTTSISGTQDTHTITVAAGSLTGSGSSSYRYYTAQVDGTDTTASVRSTDYGDGYGLGAYEGSAIISSSCSISRSDNTFTVTVATVGRSTNQTFTATNAPSVSAWMLSGDLSSATASVNVNGNRYSQTFTNWSGGGCFAAGSLVTLADDTQVPIEKLQLGQYVKTYDESTNTFKQSEILYVQLIRHRVFDVVDLYLSNNTIITVTTNHPLLTSNGWRALDISMAKKEHSQIDIDLLQIGDSLVNDLNEDIYIEKIVNRPDLSNIDVYNIDVEPYDTYLVNNIVVHNDDSVNPK